MALGVPEGDVGPRRIQFRDHRSKIFDVCWPLTGEPLILISVKSMQNAYRNLTNRIEEAFGDSACIAAVQIEFGLRVFLLYAQRQGRIGPSRTGSLATDRRSEGHRAVSRIDRRGWRFLRPLGRRSLSEAVRAGSGETARYHQESGTIASRSCRGGPIRTRRHTLRCNCLLSDADSANQEKQATRRFLEHQPHRCRCTARLAYILGPPATSTPPRPPASSNDLEAANRFESSRTSSRSTRSVFPQRLRLKHPRFRRSGIPALACVAETDGRFRYWA